MHVAFNCVKPQTIKTHSYFHCFPDHAGSSTDVSTSRQIPFCSSADKVGKVREIKRGERVSEDKEEVKGRQSQNEELNRRQFENTADRSC